MKKLIAKSLLIILLILSITACSKDETSSEISGSYLTINGDTRELVNSKNVPDLKIDKYVETVYKDNLYNLSQDIKIIGVDIYDPNRALISNFGNYNIPGVSLAVRFALPLNFEAGEYTTVNSKVIPTGKQTFGNFWIQDELFYISDSNYKITIKDEGTRYILEFINVKFGNGKATISGRIIVNKV